MQENIQSLKIEYPRRATGKVRVVGFVDHGHEIAYIASLGISGYGKTRNEAVEMLKVAFKDFFTSLMQHPEHEVHETLKKLGWEQRSYFKKQFRTSAYVDINGLLRDFDLSEETHVTESLIEV